MQASRADRYNPDIERTLPMPAMKLALALALLTALLLPAIARAGTVSVAVAANFTAPMKEIASAFTRDTGHQVSLAFGSTGKFYAQIVNGAPFEVLLAADASTPERLGQEGLGIESSRFTYAVGRLVLWSPQAGQVDADGHVLTEGKVERLAIADPRVAPYGAAAMQTLQALGLAHTYQGRLVQGESIGQAWQFVASGNVPMGFVALSQVRASDKTAGSAWIVPENLHKPIRQQAIMLKRGEGNPVAKQLLDYLRGPVAQHIITSFGYSLAP